MAQNPRPHFGADEYRSLVSLAITLVVMAALMFWPAGTWAWPRGWWFIAAFVALILVSMVVLWRLNPEIFAARKSIARGTKAWDYAMIAVLLLSFAAILSVAALDDARFHWLPLPDWVVLLGYVLIGAAFVVMVWAQAVNRHFEPGVRLQSDRGHAVVDTGPYAIVRHPGYAAGVVLAVGMALALGSLCALIPGLILAVTLSLRTRLEERALVAELPGYAEYRTRVRYRWIPRLW